MVIAPRLASASIILASDFTNPTLITFDDLALNNVLVTNQYAGAGVTFTNLCTSSGWGFGSGTEVANFSCRIPDFPAVTATFSAPQTRAGFVATTNPLDDVTISAYLGATLVGSHLFDTDGAGDVGSFVGIEFLSGFDRIVIDAANNTTGAIGVDDFRFEAAAVPEPASLMLLGSGLVGAALRARRRQKPVA